MKSLFFTPLLLLIVGVPKPGWAFSPLQMASAHIKKGNLEKAADILEQVPVHSKVYPDVVSELQKLRYRRQDWRRFFANAIFYRQVLLKDREKVKMRFRSRPLVLEILALVRHCRWKDARKVIDEIEIYAEAAGKTHELQDLDRTKKILALHAAYPKTVQSQPTKIKKTKLFSDKVFWAIDSRKLKNITHPRNLRVSVGDDCKGGA